MPRSGMHKKTARMILVLVAGLWIVTVWALSVGAMEPNEPRVGRTHCPLGDDVCDELGEGHTASPSGSGSASPSKSASPSRSASPSGSSTPRPSGSASPSGSSSPSPTPSKSTPPPPSIRTYDSRITIKGSFKGKVTSENARCVPGRKVKVKKVKKGKDATVGRDRTNNRGRWSINKNVTKGRYYAKVARKQFQGNNNTTIRCNAARSRTIRP